MPDDSYSFSAARSRLEEIVTQVRKKDTSLEKSLDLLEEGVRLANQCTELIDHADWESAGSPATVVESANGEPHAADDAGQPGGSESVGSTPESETVGQSHTEAPDDERS